MSELKQKVVKGAFWVLLQRFSTQFVSFFVALILARLLTPSDYGTVALLSIFVTVASLLVTSGMGMALVQKKDATDLDFNSMFYASLAMSLVCYGILFVSAPAIAAWYKIPDLKWMLRLISVSLVFSAMNSVQSAELSRKMLFHLSFRISLISCLTSAVAGVSLAYCGFGPWAIAWQGVITGVANVISYWFIIAWRPRWMFSWTALKGLFGFGWKVASVSVIHTVYTNAYGLIIGKAYAKEDLAFVNKGESTPNLAMSTISSTLCGVSFPALAQMQDDRPRMREAIRRMITCTSFLVFPLMTGIAVCAEDLVFVLFGQKWLPCVPYMRLACFALAIQPFHDINLQAIAAIGRADVFLRLQLIKTGIGCLLMAIFLTQDVIWFMASIAFIAGPVSLYVNTWHNRTFFAYPIWSQLRDVRTMALNCALMGACVWGIGFVLAGHPATVPLSIAKLVLQGSLGTLVYFALSAASRVPALSEYMRIPLPFLGRKMPRVASIARRIMV